MKQRALTLSLTLIEGDPSRGQTEWGEGGAAGHLRGDSDTGWAEASSGWSLESQGGGA